jgi:hypothetical protein
MGDDQVAKEFERIQEVAKLEREREIIASYHEGLAKAWTRVEKVQHDLGYLDCQLGREK